MTNTADETQADGGSDRPEDGGDWEQLPELDLPEKSLFIEEDYQEMCRVASHPVCSEILHVLQEEERLSVDEISAHVDEEATDLHSYLSLLKQVALVRNRREMRSGTDKPYSYYTLTSLGEVILLEGLTDGVQKLAAQEYEIEDRYSD